MPEGAVYVGRPSRWGNPYAVGKPYLTRAARTYYVTSPDQAVRLFRAWLAECLNPEYLSVEAVKASLAELRGKDLCCWCPLVDKDGKPVPCHADVLLELANG